jgi:MFS family permease
LLKLNYWKTLELCGEGSALANEKSKLDNRRAAYLGILSLGVVSLMGDIVYEGSRGIVPDYLTFLGATLTVVSLVGGLSEFLGYAMRLLGGYLADTTRAYWAFIFLGYGLIVAIPFLGPLNALGLGVAIVLVMLERIGKALRSPSRDMVLSLISRDVGAGKAFGLHELLDQIGAIIGPAIVATSMLMSASNYVFTFILLFAPFFILLIVLVYAYKRVGPRVAVVERQRFKLKGSLGKNFYIYTVAVLLNTMGLVPYTVILAKASKVLQPYGEQWIVPLIYMLIQGIDAPTALIFGYIYDKVGIKILAAPFLISIVPSLLTFANNDLLLLWISAVFFGLVLGMQESIYRAAVSDLTPISSRGTAYGIFNTMYGVGFLISGSLYGLLIAFNVQFAFLACYAIIIQILAVFILSRSIAEIKRSA